MNPLVSVIIPGYRCADTIAQAVDSALAQDVPLEILIIDDNDTEDLSASLAPYREYPAVIWVKNETNMGAAKSRNRGVSMARGEYVAFLDADDIWAEGKLRKQLAVIRASGTVLCATGRELMTPAGECTGRVIGVKTEITYRELLKHNCINCSSVLLKTEVAKEFPMEHEDSHEDYIMWLRILRKYERASAVNEPLLKYRLSTTGKSGNKLRSARMTFDVYRHMGFGLGKSVLLFGSYAVHGVAKYARSFLEKKHDA